MREHKYRGKRIDNGEWVYGYLMGSIGFFEEMFITKGLIYKSDKVIPETVGEYTGLKDKNDKGIFEGDIFRTRLGVVAVVEWEKEGRFLGFTISGEREIIYINREPKVEVIGNIHNNPELFQGGTPNE